jgi:hypothetical protein
LPRAASAHVLGVVVVMLECVEIIPKMSKKMPLVV